MKPKILIIDDDDKLTRLLIRFLGDFGFAVSSAATPYKGLRQLQQNSFDLLILDIMLPEMDGFEVCRKIRQKSAIPIIMLTARGDVTDRVVGLELGGDDYLAKPFEPRELVARINTVLRRTTISMPQSVSFGGLQVDRGRRQAFLDRHNLNLTTNEFNVLALLTAQPGRVFDRDEILQELRGMDCDAFNRTVDITVSRLRQKIGDDPKTPHFIKTVWGAGYVFIGSSDEDH
jgi:DNA-binding response OmpR family regulator